jgi:peptide/nickel transport system substrate-binding protein
MAGFRYGTKMRGVVTAVAVLAASSTLALAGCGGSSSGNGPSGSGGQPHRGGNLTIARSEDTQTLDPTRMYHNEDIWIAEQMYQTLYAAAPDGKSLVPQLAASYKLSADKKTWTFTLRHGVKFSSGKPMTSADVVFSINEARAKSSLWASIDSAIQSVSAPDKYTVVVQTKYPWSPLLSDLALFSNGVVPKDYGGQPRQAFFQHPVATGPFKFDHWQKGQELKLVANPSYWQQGRPYLDSVTWTVVPDANTRVLQVQGGQADIAEFPPWSSVNSLKGNPSVSMRLFPSSRTDFLAFNTKRKPFDDAHVRRAISYALNRKAMIEAVLFGHGQVSNSFLTPALWAHDPKTDGGVYSIAKAKAELAGSSVPKGFKTTLTVDPGDDSQVTLSQIIQQELKPLGITVSIRKDSNATTDTESFNYDMSFAYDTTDIIDPDELVEFAVVGSAGTHSLFTAYNDKTVNSLSLQAAHAFKHDTRQQLYSQVQERVAQDAPLAPLYYSPFAYLTSTKVQNFKVYTIGYYPLLDTYLSQ